MKSWFLEKINKIDKPLADKYSIPIILYFMDSEI